MSIDRAKLVEPKLIRFKSFDGLSVPAFVYRPTGVAPDARTPVIIDIHGGPESQTRPRLEPRRAIFRRHARRDGDPAERSRQRRLRQALSRTSTMPTKREDSVKDIGALLDWIAHAARPRSRSASPSMAKSTAATCRLAVMTHYADRLVGGVERYGISDWISFLTNTEAIAATTAAPNMAMSAIRRCRPCSSASHRWPMSRKITKPMLVMQGANDPRVPKSRIATRSSPASVANGVEVWYVVFADEGHGFLKKPNNDLRREVETVFLAKLFGTDRLTAE